MKEDFITLSLRGNPTILFLFAKINNYQPMNRNEIFREAVKYAIKNADWPRLAKVASKYNNISSSPGGPEYIQLRISRKLWEDLLHAIKYAFKPALTRVGVTYAVKQTLINYLMFLETLNLEEHNEAEEPPQTEECPIPERNEISALELSEILSLFSSIVSKNNSNTLRELRQILIKINSDYDEGN